MNFPLICRNIQADPTYGVYIPQLIRCSRACGSYQDFLDRGLQQTMKLLNQGFLLIKLNSSLRKFYDLHHDLVNRYGISVSQMTTNMGSCYSIFSFMCTALLFVLLSFFVWPLCCLSFFDLRILIIPLVSENSSYHI